MKRTTDQQQSAHLLETDLLMAKRYIDNLLHSHLVRGRKHTSLNKICIWMKDHTPSRTLFSSCQDSVSSVDALRNRDCFLNYRPYSRKTRCCTMSCVLLIGYWKRRTCDRAQRNHQPYQKAW